MASGLAHRQCLPVVAEKTLSNIKSLRRNRAPSVPNSVTVGEGPNTIRLQALCCEHLKGRWWRRRGLNPRPPRCERGALPAELLPHLRAGRHSRRFPPALSIRARPCSSRRRLNDEVFLRSADQYIEKFSASRRNHAPYAVATEKIFAVEKTDRRKPREDEITPPDGIPSTSPSPPVARVCARSRARQGLAPRVLATDRDFLRTERAYFGYSKPSSRD